MDQYTSKVTCWSDYCNPFVKVNSTTFSTETATNQKLTNETFIYFVELLPKSDSRAYFARTYTFKLSASPPDPRVSLINIDTDFETWYEVNKGNLPFYTPPPRRRPRDEQSTSADEGEKVRSQEQRSSADLIKIVNPAIAPMLAEWSDTDILLALQEAKERKTIVVPPNKAEVSLNNVGKLAIKFESRVRFPAYLEKEMGELLGRKGHDANDARRRLEVFFNTGF